MSRFIDTRGHTTLAIGICARCSRKFPRDELRPDQNSPGLMVCSDDADQLDPYRLSPRQPEDITVTDPRPDVSLSPGPMAAHMAPIPVPVPLVDDIGNVLVTDSGLVIVSGQTNTATLVTLQPGAPWSANTTYSLGAQVTPVNPVGFGEAGVDIWQFACVVAGTSGSLAPQWSNSRGILVVDGNVIWLNMGLYLP